MKGASGQGNGWLAVVPAGNKAVRDVPEVADEGVNGTRAAAAHPDQSSRGTYTATPAATAAPVAMKRSIMQPAKSVTQGSKPMQTAHEQVLFPVMAVSFLAALPACALTCSDQQP